MNPFPTAQYTRLCRGWYAAAVALMVLSLGPATLSQNPSPSSPQNQRPQRPQGGSGGSQPGGPNRPPQPGGSNRPPAQPAKPGPGSSPGRPGRPAARPPSRPNPGRPTARPPAGPRPNYQFRTQDRSRLLRQYRRSIGNINWARRQRFGVSGYFPGAYLPYFTPVPGALLGYLPPVPPGYALGYYQGYVVVYDPATFFILNLVDLLS